MQGCSTQVGSGNFNEAYSCDKAHGLLSNRTSLGVYTYGSTSHKHAVTSITNGWSFQYDANGNMTQRNVGSTYNFTYDAENRLKTVSGAATANFVYDGDGNRVKATVNGVTTVYVGNYYEERYDPASFSPLAFDNPGFETTSAWTEGTSTSFPNTSLWRGTWGPGQPHAGSYAYALSNLAYGALESSDITVSPNTQYDLYAYVRGELDPDDSAHSWQVRALYYDASHTYLSYQDAASYTPETATTTWTQRGGRVTTPANAAYLRIQLRTQMTSGWIAFDDVSLIQVGTGDNLAPNPGFESSGTWSEIPSTEFPGTSFWRSTWGTATPRSGSYAYVISNQAYGYLESNLIAVTAGAQYDLYSYVKGLIDAEGSERYWLLRAYFYDSGGVPLPSPNTYIDVASGGPGTITTSWQQKGGRFTTPTGAAQLRVQLYYYLNTGWVAYDDVSLIQVGQGNNLITNSGFEDSSGWTEQRNADFPGTGFWRGSWGPGSPHGGTYTYVISNLAYGNLQSNRMAVRSGTQYDLYAWLRGEVDVDDNGHCWQVRAVWYNASDTYLSYNDADSGCGGSLTTTWEQQGGRVTAPANAAYLRIQLRLQLISGWVAFDDVTLAGQVVATKYYYAGGQRVAMRSGVGTGTTGLLWLIMDHLGSTNKVANADGSFHSSIHYTAWGEVRATNGTLPTDYTYTGQYSYADDLSTPQVEGFGLLFYGARFYDPALGRFTSADTIVPGVGNPLAWDRYAYTLNNPLRYTDPSGHRTCTEEQAATGDETCNQNNGFLPNRSGSYRHLTEEEMKVLALLIAGESQSGEVPLEVSEMKIWALLNKLSLCAVGDWKRQYRGLSFYKIWRGSESGLIDGDLADRTGLDNWEDLTVEAQFDALASLADSYDSGVFDPIMRAVEEIEPLWYANGAGSSYDPSGGAIGFSDVSGVNEAEVQQQRDWIATNPIYPRVTEVYPTWGGQKYGFTIFKYPYPRDPWLAWIAANQ